MLTLSLPAIYSLELTSRCNNRCPGCSNVYAKDRPSSSMTLATLKQRLGGPLSEAAQIRLTGGEPTLHPELFDILAFTTSGNALVTLFTNGRWEHPAQFVKRLRGYPNLAGLLVSLHGASPQSHETFTGVQGSFSETLANIALAVDSGISVTLSTVITHQSWKEIDQVVELAQQLEVRQVTFARYLGRSLPGIEPTVGELQSALERIEALLKAGEPIKYGISIPQCFTLNQSKGCLAGVAYVAVDPWGNVRPCNHSPTIVGSLHEYTMHELWHSDAMNAWRAMIPEECTHCAAFSVCHGGCRAIQELRADGRDPLRGSPLTTYEPPKDTKVLPAMALPYPNFHIHEEEFGYALLGQGQVIPVTLEALEVLHACDGQTSFAQLSERFGKPGLDLLGELWELGMLEAT